MLFGCDLHEKPFCNHTEEEHIECGHVKIREGRWMTKEEVERRFFSDENESHVAPTREFDAGVIPDLNDDAGEVLWKRLGKDWLDGVGPVINTQAELKDYCEMTGHHIKGTSEVREVPYTEMNVWGWKSKRTKKVRIDHGFDERWGKFDRSDHAVQSGMVQAKQQKAFEARMKNQQEKRRQNPKRVFQVVKPQ